MIKKNFIRTIPVMAGYIVLGMGFGIILESKGYGIWWSFAMSLFIYAGSMQYVAVDLLSAGAGIAAAALTTIMVNSRHIFYGISMADRYKDAGKFKPYIIFGLTDETYSLVCQDETLTKKDIFLTTLFNQIYWITGSVIGSFAGKLIPWDFKGIDFALTALFVCIFTEQWLSGKNRKAAVTGLVCTLISLLIFGTENFLIPSMAAITIVLTIMKKAGGKKNAA